MKATLYDSKGKKKQEITLPKIFSSKIREDIVQKYYEADKFISPYSPAITAGNRHSAAGRVRHQRHKWGTAYGKGISRAPRKTMWRRGTQFYWVGATVSGARGGRRAHPPKGIGKEKKINEKEQEIAMNSALSATISKEYILKRYSTLKSISSIPAVIESLPQKTKELIAAIETIFSDVKNILTKHLSIRPGKGKMRGRKYKSTAGLLVITGENEKAKANNLFDSIPLAQIKISDLYPLGRLTLFTKQAIEELNKEKKNDT